MKERIEWCELPGSGTKRVISPQADVIVVHQWPTRQKPGDTPAFEALNAGRRED